ncbi:MAG: hypothetical protein KF861_02100 [Planctomycetaceae bacterium]|nr:hypothetical protein [Planctomycetaceae bacterium]
MSSTPSNPTGQRTNLLDVKAYQTLNTAAAYAAINKRPDKRDGQRRKP